MISAKLLEQYNIKVPTRKVVVSVVFFDDNRIIVVATNGKKFEQARSKHPNAGLRLNLAPASAVSVS